MTRSRGTSPDDISIIEFIPVDAAVFRDRGQFAPSPADDPSMGGPDPDLIETGPTRGASAVLGIIVALVVAIAGGIVWQLAPWHRVDGPWRISPVAAAPSLTNQLVVGAASGGPTQAILGGDQPFEAHTNILGGAVFMDALSSSGTIPKKAAVFVEVTGPAVNSNTGDGTKVHVTNKDTGATGVDGTLIHQSGGFTVLTWRTTQGTQELETSGIDDTTTVKMADSLHLQARVVTVEDRTPFAGLEVIGAVDEFVHLDEAINLFSNTATFGGHDTISYGAGHDVIFTEFATGAPGLTRLLPFLLDIAGTSTKVHGHPALTFLTGQNSQGLGAIVAWQEGGRFLMVAADNAADAQRYAESVRPATTTEWAEVVKAKVTIDPALTGG